MSVKPILFNTEMVRAILEGRKTVTRRVVKPQHLKVLDSLCRKEHPELSDQHFLEKLCAPPCGPGDILYVRETWGCWRAHRYEADAYISYKAGGPERVLTFPNSGTDSTNRDEYDKFTKKWFTFDCSWHPSIHMPKEAARIWLRVTDVRVERLLDITQEGAEREGLYVGWRLGGKGSCALSARQAFMWLWETTTLDGPAYKSWACNPWVWVISFERCEKPEEEGRA